MNGPVSPAAVSPTPLPLAIPGLMWGSSGLQTNDRPAVEWLWHGYLAARNLTLLTSLWKAGKTTLVSVLLHHLQKGSVVAGHELRPGRALVLSEESADLWRMRAGKLSFGDNIGWLCRPFRGRPCMEDWNILFHVIQNMHRQTSLDLVVVDTLASFFPLRSENEATCMLEALAPLQRLASTGPAVLVLHHPRKGRALIGQSARGHGSLQGACDISLEMYRYRRSDSRDRRRKLLGQSRYGETPARLVIELSADGLRLRHLRPGRARPKGARLRLPPARRGGAYQTLPESRHPRRGTIGVRS